MPEGSWELGNREGKESMTGLSSPSVVTNSHGLAELSRSQGQSCQNNKSAQTQTHRHGTSEYKVTTHPVQDPSGYACYLRSQGLRTHLLVTSLLRDREWRAIGYHWKLEACCCHWGIVSEKSQGVMDTGKFTLKRHLGEKQTQMPSAIRGHQVCELSLTW